ncbi:MAG TPA: LysM peptidoglycan-binding domain-containing protein [Saprospiraceae bacterium]|nr:LysM peptidoglycan-binding domain-containing protein [Saprospiraceae bacterium]
MKIFNLIFFITVFSILSAQEALVSDSLVVVDYRDDQLSILHRVKQGEGLYSIARNYNSNAIQLIKYNNLNNSNLNIAQILYIPLAPSALSLEKNQIKNSKKIYYKLKKGETLWSIASKLGYNRPDQLMQFNCFKSGALQENELICIGYFVLNPDLPSDEDVAAQPTEQDLVKTSTEAVEEAEIHYSKQSRGVAYWEKLYRDNGRFYVLHRTAKANSIVRIINPILGRSVYAKVIGKIPASYPQDAQVIVTNEVARELGAMNVRFFVEINFN